MLQNKEFVCRGHDYERLEAFQQRMLNEFPHAIAMQHVNQPDQTIYQADAQCILDKTESFLLFFVQLSTDSRKHEYSVSITDHMPFLAFWSSTYKSRLYCRVHGTNKLQSGALWWGINPGSGFLKRLMIFFASEWE